MDKRYIDYAMYNCWANGKIINDLREKDEKLLSKKLVGSFSSIRATAAHIWLVETGWLSTLLNKGWETTTVRTFKGSSKDLFIAWQATSLAFKCFVEKSDLEKEIVIQNKEGSVSLPIREIVQTVFNHGSFHRGQIVIMMRQLGISQITPTDYIEWYKEQIKFPSD